MLLFFFIPESQLFLDTLHFNDCSTLNKSTPSVSVAKFVKNNQDNLPDLPKEFDTEAKIKKLKVASFPLVLPIIKGYDFEEGHLDNNEVFTSVVDVHDLYSEWIFLHSRKYIVTSLFATENETCPVPANTPSITTTFERFQSKSSSVTSSIALVLMQP